MAFWQFRATIDGFFDDEDEEDGDQATALEPTSAADGYLIPTPSAQEGLQPLLSGSEIFDAPQTCPSVGEWAGGTKFGFDLHVKGLVLADERGDVVVGKMRHQITGKGAPRDESMPHCGSSGRYLTRLDAHQVGVHQIMKNKIFLKLRILAVEAWNTSSTFILPGPDGEDLTLPQQRQYAAWLFRIMARFLIKDHSIFILLMLVYDIAFRHVTDEEARQVLPKLISSNIKRVNNRGKIEYTVIGGVSSAFSALLPEISQGWSLIQSSPPQDAISIVLGVRRENVRKGLLLAESAVAGAPPKEINYTRLLEANKKAAAAEQEAKKRRSVLRMMAEPARKAKMAASLKGAATNVTNEEVHPCSNEYSDEDCGRDDDDSKDEDGDEDDSEDEDEDEDDDTHDQHDLYFDDDERSQDEDDTHDQHDDNYDEEDDSDDEEDGNGDEVCGSDDDEVDEDDSEDEDDDIHDQHDLYFDDDERSQDEDDTHDQHDDNYDAWEQAKRQKDELEVKKVHGLKVELQKLTVERDQMELEKASDSRVVFMKKGFRERQQAVALEISELEKALAQATSIPMTPRNREGEGKLDVEVDAELKEKSAVLKAKVQENNKAACEAQKGREATAKKAAFHQLEADRARADYQRLEGSLQTLANERNALDAASGLLRQLEVDMQKPYNSNDAFTFSAFRTQKAHTIIKKINEGNTHEDA